MSPSSPAVPPSRPTPPAASPPPSRRRRGRGGRWWAGVTAAAGLALALALALTGARGAAPTAPDSQSDGAISARSLALDLAGAFANDGYKIRDGHWSGTFTRGEPQVVSVNLYAGNQYYFALASGDRGRKVAVRVYDEAGKPVPDAQVYQSEDRPVSAVGVSPVASGQYFVSVELLAGESAEFCLVYTYR